MHDQPKLSSAKLGRSLLGTTKHAKHDSPMPGYTKYDHTRPIDANHDPAVPSTAKQDHPLPGNAKLEQASPINAKHNQ